MKAASSKSMFHPLMLVMLLLTLISGAVLTMTSHAAPSARSLSASGDMLLATRIGGTGWDSGRSILVDPSGTSIQPGILMAPSTSTPAREYPI